MAGDQLDNLEINLRTEESVREVNALTTSLGNNSAAMKNNAVAMTDLEAAVIRSKEETAALRGIQAQYGGTMAEVRSAVRALAQEEKAAALAATEVAAATKETTISFAQQKLVMRELMGTMEAATGVHTGLRGVIRMALNPEILILMASMYALGKAVQFVNNSNKELMDEMKKVEDNIVRQGEAAERLEEKHLRLTAAEKFAREEMVKIKALRMDEEWEAQGKAISRAEIGLEIWNGIAAATGFMANLTANMFHLLAVAVGKFQSAMTFGIIKSKDLTEQLDTWAAKYNYWAAAAQLSKEKQDELNASLNRFISISGHTAAGQSTDPRAQKTKDDAIREKRLEEATKTANALAKIDTDLANKRIALFNGVENAAAKADAKRVAEASKNEKKLEGLEVKFTKVSNTLAKERAKVQKEAMMDILDASSAFIQETFGKTKAASIAVAGIHLFEGITDIWAKWGAYPIVAGILTGIESATVDQSIRHMQGTNIGQAHDGMIFPSSGSYLMNVERGEGIMSSNGMQELTSALRATNEGGGFGGGSVHYHYHGTVFDRDTADRHIAQANKRGMKTYGIRG